MSALLLLSSFVSYLHILSDVLKHVDPNVHSLDVLRSCSSNGAVGRISRGLIGNCGDMHVSNAARPKAANPRSYPSRYNIVCYLHIVTGKHQGVKLLITFLPANISICVQQFSHNLICWGCLSLKFLVIKET